MPTAPTYRALLMLTLLVCTAAPAGASDDLLTPATQQAIDRGIAYLLETQNPNGSWLSDGSTGRFPVAMTALGGLALLAHGNTCYSGPHAGSVRRAVEYLLRQSDPQTGLIGDAEGVRPMFGHSYAMLFLAEAYGSEGEPVLRERLRGALLDAVRLTAGAQTEEGGWYYTPEPTDHEGAVTMTQLQGLRSCANAGLPVPAEMVERAMEYVRLSAQPSGGVAYKIDQPHDTRAPLSAAAVVTMYAAGIYEGEMVEGALRYALRNIPTSAPVATGGGNFFYAHLYLSQVMHFRGSEPWHRYYSELRDWLLSVQQPDGSWQGDYIGTTYGTAVALIVLQLPHNNLPILQP